MGLIEDFLDLYSAQNTRGVYRSGIFAFFGTINNYKRKNRIPSPEDIVSYEEMATRYFAGENDPHNDLMRFAASMADRPPHTAKSYINAVKEFFAFHGFEMSERELRRIRSKLPKGRTRTVEKILDYAALRTILHHMDVHGKALILTLASSGMRIGETLQIRMTDVNLETNPAEIEIRGEYTKTGEQRFTFISREAVDLLREWYKVRQDYLNTAKNRNAGLVRQGIGSPKNPEDDRVFPFSDDVVYEMWKNALKDAGLFSVDSATNRNQRAIHSLRKFFRSQLARDCPVDVVEMLMGHEGYLTDAYRRFTKEQAAEMYKKAEHCVTISIPKEIREIESEFKQKVDTHSEILENIVRENIQLKDQMSTISKNNEREKFLREQVESDPVFAAVKKAAEEAATREYSKLIAKK